MCQPRLGKPEELSWLTQGEMKLSYNADCRALEIEEETRVWRNCEMSQYHTNVISYFGNSNMVM